MTALLYRGHAYAAAPATPKACVELTYRREHYNTCREEVARDVHPTLTYRGVTGDAPVGQGWVHVARDFLPAGVVVLASVGQFNAGLGSGWSCCVGVASIEKCSHWMFLEEIQVPVPWLGVSAPLQKG